MEEYLEDTRPTLDELCKEYGDEDCKDCPAYEFCHNERRERMNKNIAILFIGFVVAAFAIGIGIGIKTSNPKESKATEYHNECPMCHSNVKLTTFDSTYGCSYQIECLNRDCELETGYYEDKEELIEKWNKMFKTLSERKGK